MPTSRSNHGQTQNKPDTTNPNGAFGSSVVGNDQFLSPAVHHASSNSSYNNALKANTAGRNPRLTTAQQPGCRKEKGRCSLPRKRDEGVTADKKEEGN